MRNKKKQCTYAYVQRLCAEYPRNHTDLESMFTPIETSIGAVLLHQATSLLLHNNGGILGASEYIRRMLSRPTIGVAAFFAGMATSFPLLGIVAPDLLTTYPSLPMTSGSAVATVFMGLLAGWGTKVGNQEYNPMRRGVLIRIGGTWMHIWAYAVWSF